MKILIAGNMGYVGPVVVRHLRLAYADAQLIGLDAGLFAHCLLGSGPVPESCLDLQYFGDVRAIDPDVLQGVNAVINLAAISNDPMGNRFEDATQHGVGRDALDLGLGSHDQAVREHERRDRFDVVGRREISRIETGAHLRCDQQVQTRARACP